MTKPRTLTPEQEMAYHLDGIARGCRDGNTYSLGEARRMLASKVLLVALECLVDRNVRYDGRTLCIDFDSQQQALEIIRVARTAIAKAT